MNANSALEARLRDDIVALTRFQSRVPGTTGNLAAASYVQNRFQQIGLQRVKAEPFKVTAPVTRRATLSLGGRTLPLFPMYPNQVVAPTTPPAGLTGPLVYAGTGNPRDFNGKTVLGSIVVLDFDSGLNWITAADLGAQAVIFLEPTGDNAFTTRGQAERKFTSLPVEVPRYYAAGPVAEALRDGSGEATVRSLVTWERVTSLNVTGFLPGKNVPKEGANTVIINAYYDSMSAVPDIAPGAEAAGNMAAMLELARRMKASPPNYNVLFLANGAHHLALAGIRSFIADHVVDKDGKASEAKKKEMESYRTLISLDLTSRTPTLGLFAKGWFYNQMSIEGQSENILLGQFNNLAKVLKTEADALGKRRGVPAEQLFVEGITGAEGRSWRSYLPAPVAFDSEAATMAQLPGLALVTANDVRLLQDTPFDTLERMNLSNLAAQIGTAEAITRRTLREVGASDAKNELIIPDKSTLSPNFGFFVGRAVYRDLEEATSFLPDSPMPDSQIGDAGVQSVAALVSGRDGNARELKTYAGVRGIMIERATYSKPTQGTKAVSQFIFEGPRVGDPKGGGTPQMEFEAFSINENGHLIYAPDRGSERQRFSPMFNKVGTLAYRNEKLGQWEPTASLITFKSRASTVFDTLDQRYFTVLREVTILDAKTDANPVEYGYLRPVFTPGAAEVEPVAIVFMRENDRFKMIMAAGLLGKRLVLINAGERRREEGANVGKFAQSLVTPNSVGTGDAAIPDEEANDSRVSPEGRGFLIANAPLPNRVTQIAYQTALDLWILDQARIRLLKGFGINNERVDALHGAAGCERGPKRADGSETYECPTEAAALPTGGSLALAAAALNSNQYDNFYRHARRAFGLESRAYPDVEATSQDVLKGIIFYLALLLPFAFFVERLMFGFPDIRKQIVGTALVFLAVFIAIRFVHPAFELALTPFIILLAFVILALTVVVTAFLQGKFEQEIKRMKSGVHHADMGRLSAVGAALGLGIANMRRRPTRTALTCVTLILLTFTVLSFTSVTANIANFARLHGDGRTPPYQGMLIRQPDWSAMNEVAVSSLQNGIIARGLGEPALRAWYLSRDQGEALQLRVANAENPAQFYHAPALIGMMPQEKEVGSPVPGTLVSGRWFEEGDRDVALVPRDMLLTEAQRKAETPQTEGETTKDAATDDATAQPLGSPLGLTLENAVGSTVTIGGREMEIIGIFDDRKLYSRTRGEDNLRDIDAEEFTPVDYSSDVSRQNAQANTQASNAGDEVQVQRYEHMPANALLILPYQTAIDMGGTTRSIAVGIEDPVKAEEELEDLMDRAALGIFGATPDSNGKLVSRLYSSVEATSYEGFAALAVPVLIAALIIANTMLGSVFERTREIGIYSSIGLAPVHVAALFIAEAAVYAVLGSISGYLIAQVVAKVITATNLLPGITLNYSSSSAVIATLIVMATVLLSTIYPAWAASRVANPNADTKDLGEPWGDLWRLQFPFTVSGTQSVGMAQFLADYFETHTDTSVGKFYTDEVHFSALPLREAVAILNEGVPHDEMSNGAANGATDGYANGHSNGAANGASIDTPSDSSEVVAVVTPSSTETATRPRKKMFWQRTNTQTLDEKEQKKRIGQLHLEDIAADPETEVYQLSLRTWMAPFDMGVSQDTDIILVPAKEPGLYELQLRLERRSGEIAAWKRVNRDFMTELRKQLLVWRTIKPDTQQEYILRGRAHIRGQVTPHEEPEAVVV